MSYYRPVCLLGMKARSNATWKPRMLAVTALWWGTSGLSTLTERFELARKIVAKVFRWLPSPGATYQGFMKMLGKWHTTLLLAIVPEARVQLKEMLPGQWRIAGYVVFAGDGSRIELALLRAFARLIGGAFSRAEGTIDLMPNDLIYHTHIGADGRPAVDPGPLTEHGEALALSIALTVLGLFIVGASMSLFTGRHAALSGLRMLGIGGAAGLATYFIGAWLVVTLG